MSGFFVLLLLFFCCTLDFHKEEALTLIHSKYHYLLELIVTPFYSLASKFYNDGFLLSGEQRKTMQTGM